MDIKKNLCLASFFCIYFVGNAQDMTSYNNKNNSVFQYVDKSKISTGLLYDYGLHMVSPTYYNGTTINDDNYIDIDLWKFLYGGMYSSKINSNISLSTPELIETNINNQSSNSLAIMHLKYNIYKSDALSSGLVSVRNEQIYDISGKNPYEEKFLFAIAPKESYYKGKTISFKFNSSLFINNTGKSVKTLQINFNNETGYMNASWNSVISHTFASIGFKDIYFRITYTDNTTYTCRTKISIYGDNPISLRSADLTRDISPSSQHSGGQIQIKYAFGNTSSQIRKPLIVAEGFDPSSVLGLNNLDISYLIDSAGYVGSFNIGYPNIYNNINSFDVIYLDYNDGLDDIKRNAKLFQEVIEYVNSNKVGNHPNIVMGISMGGLVARYALRKMETENKDHDTWKYISVDSPHKGANVPIGFQAFIRHLADVKVSSGFIPLFQVKNLDVIKKALGILDSKAAKQMLTYYVSSNSQINNSEHLTFQTEYDNLGFPQRCENIAVSNGTKNGTKLMEPNTVIADFSEDKKLDWWANLLAISFGDLLSLTNLNKAIILKWPGNSHVLGTLKINAAPNKQSSTVYNGKLWVEKRVFGIKMASATLFQKTFNSNTSTYPLDGAPGGYYKISTVAGGLPAGMIKKEEFTFIPTVSALALSNWETQLNSNLASMDLSSYTGFKRYFIPTTNERHTNFYTSASFLVNEINSTPTDAIITGTVNISSNRQFNRNIIVKNGATLNILSGVTLDASNKKIIVEQGGKVVANNNSVIYCKNIDVAAGGTFSNDTRTILNFTN